MKHSKDHKHLENRFGKWILCCFPLIYFMFSLAIDPPAIAGYKAIVSDKNTWKGVVKGNVTETGTGKPIPNTEVTLVPENPNEPPKRAKATPDGKYEIPNVPDGAYTLIAKGT